jgi:CO/xanthine dehydrogenase FAD-binding subunit
MEVLRPDSLDEAVSLRRRRPDAVPIAGGTVVTVLLNRGRLSPPALLDLGSIEELRGWSDDGDSVRLGAALTYAELLEPTLARRCPALAQAAAVVGSPQIRNRGTLGGCLGSGGGDVIPALLVERAEVEVAGGARVPLEVFLRDGSDLVVAVHVHPVERESFTKVGRRNAFSPTLVSAAFAVDGSDVRAAATGRAVQTRLVADRAGLVDCGRDAYSRHVLGVLARRALES